MNDVSFRLKVLLSALLAILALGTAGFMAVERLSFLDSLYFNVATIATVGYGDIHPETAGGRILAMVIIVTGVGVFLGVIANFTELMLNRRERQARMERLNVAIGLFFSEIGTKLLGYFSTFDPQIDGIRQDLIVNNGWSAMEFGTVGARLKAYEYIANIPETELGQLKSFFLEQNTLLLRLMENPNLHEHESFTDLLMAVFHLREELYAREALTGLPETDIAHIRGDIQRAYAMLVQQWLAYMKHLKDNYPFLFSLAVRTNPFDRAASPIVK